MMDEKEFRLVVDDLGNAGLECVLCVRLCIVEEVVFDEKYRMWIMKFHCANCMCKRSVAFGGQVDLAFIKKRGH